jgi:hypothetical protein
MTRYPAISNSKSSAVSILFFLLSFTSTSIAQDLPPLKGPAVYLAVFGTTPGVSINSEFRVFNTKQRTAYLMAGFGTLDRKECRYLAIPIGLNLVKGRGIHHSEVGAAFTYNEGSQTAGTNVGNKSLYFAVTGGYRYQRSTGGFFFRLYYSPRIKLKEWGDEARFGAAMTTEPTVFGAGIGYSFRNRK